MCNKTFYKKARGHSDIDVDVDAVGPRRRFRTEGGALVKYVKLTNLITQRTDIC